MKCYRIYPLGSSIRGFDLETRGGYRQQEIPLSTTLMKACCRAEPGKSFRDPLWGAAGHQEVEGTVALAASLSGIILPVFGILPGTVFPGGSQTTPASRPLPRPPPAPSRGRAVIDDSPGYSARGAGKGSRGGSTETVVTLSLALYLWGITPWGWG